MAVENGKVVYTGLLNEKGGFETDVTATRVDQNTYFVVCPTAQATRDMHVMKRSAQEDEFVTFSDVTSSYSVLGVMGPHSATLLEAVGPEGVNLMCDENFPFGTSKTVGVGSIQAEAKRISFVGELGWELYVPTECATHAYEALFETAKEHNIDLKNAGYYAIDSLRVEKGYRAWGHDLTTDYTPLEAGLGFMIDWSKDFIGKQALQKQKDEGLQRRMLSFVLEDPDAMPWGDEAIWMDGKIVGYCTSTTFGHTVGSAVTLGYVEHEDVKNKGFLKRHKFEISLGAKQIPAKA
jgi:4-methylaminobutanoate oxidase (formaldehyde-forming)